MKELGALSQQTSFEHTRGTSTAVLLFVLFSCLYTALGPGYMFGVDEVVVQEMAQSVFLRGTLEVPAMNTARPGLGGHYYARRGPALGYTAMPLVALGTLLDDRWRSITRQCEREGGPGRDRWAVGLGE